MSQQNTPTQPDARIEISVVCDQHDPAEGMKKLNPMLQEIMNARKASGQAMPSPQRGNPHFGRLSFSQALA
ncbi:MAG TPA: hypothetical protein VFG43_03625 [Geminicoccaceae bacterium]|nr:hypothetical protein [Geminicoccaceae bacterium]